MSLPDPPENWMRANGYGGYLSDERRREARAHFHYEREMGRPFVGAEPGTPRYEQFAYVPKRDVDPRDVVA